MITIECNICDLSITHDEEYFQSHLFQFKEDSSNIPKSTFYSVHKKCWNVLVKNSSNFMLLLRSYTLLNQYKDSVRNEISMKNLQGILWENNRCVDWNNFLTALQEFTNLEIFLLKETCNVK